MWAIHKNEESLPVLCLRTRTVTSHMSSGVHAFFYLWHRRLRLPGEKAMALSLTAFKLSGLYCLDHGLLL